MRSSVPPVPLALVSISAGTPACSVGSVPTWQWGQTSHRIPGWGCSEPVLVYIAGSSLCVYMGTLNKNWIGG